MAAEDYTTFSTTDGSGDLTVNAGSIVVSTNLDTASTYVTKDFTLDHFNDLDIDSSFLITASSTNGILALAAGVTVTATTKPNNFSTTDAWIGLNQEVGGCRVGLYRGGIAASNLSGFILSLNTTYYATISRSAASDTINLFVYTDSGRTSQITGSPFTLSSFGSGTRYRHLYGYSVFPQVGLTFDGTVSNLNVNEAAAVSIPVVQHHLQQQGVR